MKAPGSTGGAGKNLILKPGVGQYQHDVKSKEDGGNPQGVVEDCVNSGGGSQYRLTIIVNMFPE